MTHLTHVIIKFDPLNNKEWKVMKIIPKAKLQPFKQYLLQHFNEYKKIVGLSKCTTYTEVLEHFEFTPIKLQEYINLVKLVGSNIGEIPIYTEFKEYYKTMVFQNYFNTMNNLFYKNLSQ